MQKFIESVNNVDKTYSEEKKLSINNLKNLIVAKKKSNRTFFKTNHIVIKADTGSATITLHVEDYISKANDQFKNNLF